MPGTLETIMDQNLWELPPIIPAKYGAKKVRGGTIRPALRYFHVRVAKKKGKPMLPRATHTRNPPDEDVKVDDSGDGHTSVDEGEQHHPDTSPDSENDGSETIASRLRREKGRETHTANPEPVEPSVSAMAAGNPPSRMEIDTPVGNIGHSSDESYAAHLDLTANVREQQQQILASIGRNLTLSKPASTSGIVPLNPLDPPPHSDSDLAQQKRYAEESLAARRAAAGKSGGSFGQQQTSKDGQQSSMHRPGAVAYDESYDQAFPESTLFRPPVEWSSMGPRVPTRPPSGVNTPSKTTPRSLDQRGGNSSSNTSRSGMPQLQGRMTTPSISAAAAVIATAAETIAHTNRILTLQERQQQYAEKRRNNLGNCYAVVISTNK
jgi:hypothetical protein